MKTASDLIAESKSRIRQVTVAEVQQALAGTAPPMVIDCREPQETNLGRIPGALVIPAGRARDEDRGRRAARRRHRPLLREWEPLCAGCGHYAADGVHACRVDGRWVRRVGGRGRAGRVLTSLDAGAHPFVARVERALAARPGVPAARDGTFREAAVALVLRPVAADAAEVLLIRRAERADDPWSGQIGLPGVGSMRPMPRWRTPRSARRMRRSGSIS